MNTTNRIIPIAFGILLTALVGGMVTTIDKLYAVHADTTAIRVELAHMNNHIERNEGDITDLQTAVASINIDVMENKNNIKILGK